MRLLVLLLGILTATAAWSVLIALTLGWFLALSVFGMQVLTFVLWGLSAFIALGLVVSKE